MYRKLIMGIVVLFGLSNISAQQIKEYRQQILKAEKLIVENSYNEAIAIYANAFETSEIAFGRDIYTALSLADDRQNLESFAKILQYLNKKCISKETLLKDPMVRRHMGNDMVRAIVDAAECNPTKSNLLSYDEYEKLLDMLSLADKNEKALNSMVEKKLRKWIKNKELLPLDQEVSYLNIKGETIFDIFISLYCRQRASNRNLPPATEWLILQVENGRLEPNKAAHWIDLQNDNFKTGSIGMMTSINKTAKDQLYTSELIETINNNRSRLYLDEFETWAEKRELIDKKFIPASY